MLAAAAAAADTKSEKHKDQEKLLKGLLCVGLVSRCGCCRGSREGRKLALRSANWSQWCAMTQNLDEPEWLLAFFEACTTHRRTAELLGGVEELVLKVWLAASV
eukprot:scaffold55719_cov20-Tisochrysis_lutea.AAC.2